MASPPAVTAVRPGQYGDPAQGAGLGQAFLVLVVGDILEDGQRHAQAEQGGQGEAFGAGVQGVAGAVHRASMCAGDGRSVRGRMRDDAPKADT
jgi:hypothetical protein